MAYIGVQPTDTYLSIASQQITGTGSATYTLDYSVSNEEDVAVFVNNVRQNVSSYTVSGTSLTLGGTISSSDECWVLFLGRTVGTKTPAVGSVTNAMLAGSIATSKLADGSTFATTNGITTVDQWRLTTGFTGDASPIASNLERVDSSAFGQIGSGMSVSSGYWTFPSTGVYLVLASGFFRFGTVGGEEADGNFQIYATTDNSTYNLLTGSKFSFAYDYAIRENHRTISAVVDVTNTTNVKVYFTTNAVTSGTTTSGNTDRNETHFTFIRLGDT